MNTENVYLGHDNAINLILKSNGSAVDTSGFTKMTLTLGTAAVESANSTASISWNAAGYADGEIRLHLGGHSTITAGRYEAPLIVYNATAASGIMWGNVPLSVISEVEGAT